jgi:hypothetical protein
MNILMSEKTPQIMPYYCYSLPIFIRECITAWNSGCRIVICKYGWFILAMLRGVTQICLIACV